MTAFASTQSELLARPRRWLVTGAAGFIGSHLVQRLLELGQLVVGLDNFSTGKRANLEDVRMSVGAAWERFRLVECDIRSREACDRAMESMDFVLHQAALGSVPRSMVDPATSFDVNVNGFLNVALAARGAKLRVVYASSSSVYGDSPSLPKVEDVLGKPLSPYAATKRINEVTADALASSFQMEFVGLRYFNVFGARQDPFGAYAAVIPRWIAAMLQAEPCVIHGDGATSRDFCYVSNVVQANILAAVGTSPGATVCNVACGKQTSLLGLHALLGSSIQEQDPGYRPAAAVHGPARAGDITHSLASIERVQRLFGYEATHTVEQGMLETVRHYFETSWRVS